MLKILEAKLQQTVNHEFPDVQAGFRKGRGSRDQMVNIHWPLDHRKNKRIPEKHLLLLYWLHQSLWLCRSQQTVENYSRDGITDHLTFLLRNLSVGQEATVRTEHGTTDWFLIGNGIHQGCILSCCLFNLNAEYIMWNARLDEAQAGIKIAGRNLNNLRYANVNHSNGSKWRESKELLDESKRGEWKSCLKTQHSKNKDHGI